MGEWKEKSLIELADIIPGFAFKSNDFGPIGEIVIKIKDIHPPLIDLSSTEKVNTSNYDKNKLKKYLLEYGDFVVAMTGATIGKVGRLKEKKPAFINQRVAKINAKKGVNNDFIYYSVTSYDFQVFIQNNIDSHSAQENISGNSIGRFPILAPPLPEQTAIASILSSLDDKIDLLHRQNATLEKMAETLFRQWFVEEAKEEWENGKVSDLIKILSGYAFKSSSFVESGKYRLITIKGVQDGYLELNNADKIDEVPDRMPDFCKLEIGDIILSLTGNVGRCCLVDTTDLLLNQRVAKLHPIYERDRAYTYFLFRQPQIKQLLEEMGKGTAQPNLSPIETSNMELIIPDEEKLIEFSVMATPLLNKMLFNKKSIQTLTALRDTLLPKLMSGEVRVVQD